VLNNARKHAFEADVACHQAGSIPTLLRPLSIAGSGGLVLELPQRSPRRSMRRSCLPRAGSCAWDGSDMGCWSPGQSLRHAVIRCREPYSVGPDLLWALLRCYVLRCSPRAPASTARRCYVTRRLSAETRAGRNGRRAAIAPSRRRSGSQLREAPP
jgi:hypothetical protein